MSSPEDLLEGEPPIIDPYEVLGLERTAPADKIKTAYRKAALKHHPDKVPVTERDEAHQKFQSIALAYAILSDPARRKRYDDTGSTSESIVDTDGFSWSDYYREQYKDAVSDDAIDKFAKIYKGSDEEKDDLLMAYEKFEGDMNAIYETVMLSDVLVDDERFRAIIDEAIASKDVPAFKKYTKESKKSREARIKAAKDEGNEAEEYAKELGVHDKLFGSKKTGSAKASKGKKDSEADLLALIQGNQKSRQQAQNSFLDSIAAKYAPPPKKGGKGKKRVADDDEPSEEAFQAAAAKLKKGRNVGRSYLAFFKLGSGSIHAGSSKDAMTREESRVYYPQYCFHLSRTIDQWCPLRIVDIHELHASDAHRAQGIFFLSNHPIAWVRIAGVVVAVDYYYGRFVYTIDDSSGQCIDCALEMPSRPAPDAAAKGQNTNLTVENGAAALVPVPPGPPQSEYDVGMVVIIKGSVQVFRDQKQLKIHKIQIVRSTEQEVQFWNKIRDFRNQFLARPWELSSEDLRQCRADYLKEERRQARKQGKESTSNGKSTHRHGNGYQGRQDGQRQRTHK
ncbi:hypothetical protein Micbo1qcDRAFT_140573 [Microdochium bolleyi]|uniref:J domain-containing protein n=1 Tax=Microdochium bolleyi TaxID=196109 RepID=A0A136INA5_9PEZI|nr:hypothetical protein Micbo1qcDRAFT_140573 [Microdochium bolleyi]